MDIYYFSDNEKGEGRGTPSHTLGTGRVMHSLSGYGRDILKAETLDKELQRDELLSVRNFISHLEWN